MTKHESDYKRVFNIIDHPEAYRADELAQILSDPETKEIYNLLSATASAQVEGEVDVDAEWRDFSHSQKLHGWRRFIPSGNRAASIAVIIFSSIVAVAAGIAATVAVIDRRAGSTNEGDTEEIAGAVAVASDTLHTEVAEVTAEGAAIMFENEALETIMGEVADAYGVEVIFDNREVADLRLYYRLDLSLTLDEIISQLNTFDHINITHEGNRLTID